MSGRLETVERLKAQSLAPFAPATTLERAAAELAEAMAEIHGGKWNVRINHDRCLVLIAREVECGQSVRCRSRREGGGRR